ncbi:Mpo1-like protein [Tundrisphaera lichenicola]|uniref:Mpo1-like protein n=1 Tax=Tundrisphaera lichenicola TaxID=2029860 RepID=UPI003EBE75D2
MSDLSSVSSSKLDQFVTKYRADHTHPVNHFLHLGVGWPMCAAAAVLLPFRPLWSVGLFLGGYFLMFAGHFLFEGNTPTILKHPATPFVIAWAVIRGICGGIARLITGGSSR